MAGGLNPDFTTMLTFNECVNIFDQWLEKKLDGTANSIKIKKTSGSKNSIEWRSGKNKYNGYITDNIVKYGYSNPVAVFYVGSSPHKTNVMGAIKDLEGDNGPIQDSIKQRFLERENKEGISHTKIPEASPEDKAKNEAERIQRQFETNRLDLISRLPAAFVAQYAYLASKEHENPAYHQGQQVQSVETHPYVKKKGFEIDSDVDDFLILSQHVPTVDQMITFINSPVCKLPRNDFSVTKEDVIAQIKDPASTFSYSKYFNKNDVQSGIGITPSRDSDGVITNIQKYMTKPFLKNGKYIDKVFLENAVLVGTGFIFNHKEKLDPSYSPKNIILTEGWATGKTINHPLKDNKETMIVVAWNAYQLKAMAELYLNKHPDANLHIAADNDCKSFFKANTKDPDKLMSVKNTGLQSALATYISMPEHQQRMGILIPRINYEKYNIEKGLSDFDDIRMGYGINAAVKEFNGELERLRLRKEAGISEVPRITKMYNAQAQFYSNEYQIELSGINQLGELDTVVIKPTITNDIAVTNTQQLEQSPKKLEVVAEPPVDELGMPDLQGDISSFFNKPVNNAIKTAFDIQLEQGISTLIGSNETASQKIEKDANKEPTPKDMIVFSPNNPTEKIPDVQPMVNPADFTLMLYQRGLMEQFTEVLNQPSKEKMIETLQNNVYSMGGLVRTLHILLDDTMRPHLANSIDKVLDGYQDRPFYKDLVTIKEFASEQLIQKSLVDQEALKSFHKDLVSSYLQGMHADKGFDKEVVAEMSNSAISRRPIEEKREFYRQFVHAIQNLSDDDKWISYASQSLESSYKMAQNQTQTHPENKPEQSQNNDEMNKKDKGNNLSFD